jgi:chromosome segregation ATPase
VPLAHVSSLLSGDQRRERTAQREETMALFREKEERRQLITRHQQLTVEGFAAVETEKIQMHQEIQNLQRLLAETQEKKAALASQLAECQTKLNSEEKTTEKLQQRLQVVKKKSRSKTS